MSIAHQYKRWLSFQKLKNKGNVEEKSNENLPAHPKSKAIEFRIEA